MINLSKLGRASSELSLVDKLKSLRYPDIYQAEKIIDLVDEGPNLPFPWYKKTPMMGNCNDRVYIIIENIGIRKLEINGVEIPHYFIVHDETYPLVTYWNGDHEYFPTLQSFEEVGLKKEDHVCDILLKYLINQKFPSIVGVNNFPRKKPKRKENINCGRNYDFTVALYRTQGVCR